MIDRPARRMLLGLLALAVVESVSQRVTKFVAATEPAIATQPAKPFAAKPFAATIAGAIRSEMVTPAVGLVFYELPSTLKPDDSVVVLVPGLLAREDSMESLRLALNSDRHYLAIFRYSSHEGITSAAQMLAKELRTLQASEPNREVVLLTHSMGGLVARACIEDPENNPGNVKQLIMLAPPNHGSAVAGLSAADLAKTFSWPEDAAKNALATVDDALGEFFGNAKEELRPDSIFLQTLNSRSRAAGVAYSILAGSGGPIRRDVIEASLLIGGMFFGDQPDTKASLQRIGQLARYDEWTSGRGDGVVAIESAKLEGVSDFVTLPFSHNAFDAPIITPVSSVADEINRRLSRPTR